MQPCVTTRTAVQVYGNLWECPRSKKPMTQSCGIRHVTVFMPHFYCEDGKGLRVSIQEYCCYSKILIVQKISRGRKEREAAASPLWVQELWNSGIPCMPSKGTDEFGWAQVQPLNLIWANIKRLLHENVWLSSCLLENHLFPQVRFWFSFWINNDIRCLVKDALSSK